MLETGRITNTNEYGEPIVNCSDLMELVYQGYDIDKVKVNDERVEKYNSIINDLDYNQLIILDEFINQDDEFLKSTKNKTEKLNINSKFNFILEKFKNFK